MPPPVERRSRNPCGPRRRGAPRCRRPRLLGWRRGPARRGRSYHRLRIPFWSTPAADPHSRRIYHRAPAPRRDPQPIRLCFDTRLPCGRRPRAPANPALATWARPSRGAATHPATAESTANLASPTPSLLRHRCHDIRRPPRPRLTAVRAPCSAGSSSPFPIADGGIDPSSQVVPPARQPSTTCPRAPSISSRTSTPAPPAPPSTARGCATSIPSPLVRDNCPCVVGSPGHRARRSTRIPGRSPAPRA
jgi:hypothetical protein